ncbi:MAG: NADPH-dependent F420 reductase [Solirubrobacteraceae bacterium]|nr:NADPH-dependent F420 reductase [Solirubrobacteraceae bacterium]
MSDLSATSEPVAIVGGSGALGSGLALRFAAAGVPVVVGSRDQERATEAVRKLEAKLGAAGSADAGALTAADNAGAVAAAEVVVLCVPFRNHSETFTSLRGAFRPGQLVVDATVPLAAAVSGKATRTIGVWQGSAAQQADEMLPEGVRVVAALHTVSAKTLGTLGQALDEDVLVCGDDRADKARVAALLQRIDGLRAVDAGPLEQARIVESLTAMLIGMNVRHRAHAGIRITGLPSDLWPEHTNHEDQR